MNLEDLVAPTPRPECLTDFLVIANSPSACPIISATAPRNLARLKHRLSRRTVALEIDFVTATNSFLETKRGPTSPIDFSWFERVAPGSRLLVISDTTYEARSVKGIRLDDFLRGG